MVLLGDFLSPTHLIILAAIVAGIWWWAHVARARRRRQDEERGYLRGRLEEREKGKG